MNIQHGVLILIICSVFLAGCTGTALPQTPPVPDQSVEQPIQSPNESTEPPATTTPEPDLDEPVGSPTHSIKDTPLDPQPIPGIDEEGKMRGQVFLDGAQLLILESFPIQPVVVLIGNLPTPCHKLKVFVVKPDAQSRIDLQVYSLVDPNEMCVQVLSPFEERVALSGLEDGHYSVWVNGMQIGEFKYP